MGTKTIDGNLVVNGTSSGVGKDIADLKKKGTGLHIGELAWTFEGEAFLCNISTFENINDNGYITDLADGTYVNGIFFDAVFNGPQRIDGFKVLYFYEDSREVYAVGFSKNGPTNIQSILVGADSTEYEYV